MALYAVTKNNPSAAQDLNQVVNLLTGTTTNTQVTVANRVTAQMTGATAASAYAGGYAGPPYGSGTFAAGDLSVDNYYNLLWTCYTPTGGSLPQGAWQSSGAGGMVARWYQSNPQTLSAGGTVNLISLDTESFDVSVLWNTLFYGYVIPITGQWAFAGAVHRLNGSSGTYRFTAVLLHNGVEASRGDDGEVSGIYGGSEVQDVLLCSQGDVVQLGLLTNGSPAGTTDTTNPARTYLSMHYIGSQLQ